MMGSIKIGRFRVTWLHSRDAARWLSTRMCRMPKNTAEGGCATTHVEDIVRRVSSRGFEKQIRPIPYRTGPYASVSRNIVLNLAPWTRSQIAHLHHQTRALHGIELKDERRNLSYEWIGSERFDFVLARTSISAH